MIKNHLEIDGILIEILRKPIKNIHLRIYPPHGEIKMSVPCQLSWDLIHKQLETKREWIHAQRARLKEQVPVPPLLFATGETILFLGTNHALTVHETKNREKILLVDKTIHCFIHSQSTIVKKQQLLQNWYRQQMKAFLPSLIAKWESIIGVKVNSWGIKTMKTRWGSCNTDKKRIWLNLNLIKKPLACLEYVLVHELVHLLEAGHNKRFYNFMDQFLPAWQENKRQLEDPKYR
ncbi:M48 family metallopeptidase [Legionella fairfieldensis]|uniref:M48 family metallopeptidase n=1 Tax=Legionella fairfieldensis TaxID=45064 RepID=UPI00048B5CBE|nr:SprT family zinc-dependent metalloprotease [Legionella fairfieldensis]